MALFSHPHTTAEMDKKVEAALRAAPDDIQQMLLDTFNELADEVYQTGYCQGVDEAEED